MRTANAPSCIRPQAVGDTEPRPAEDSHMLELVQQPWVLRVGHTPMIVRPSSARDLAGVARMHSRCSARSLLDRYRSGGRPPTVAAIDASLREPYGVVVTTSDGDVVATGNLTRDRAHNRLSAAVALLVEDRWQRHGIGGDLATHLAGVAQVIGYHELIAYPATAVTAAQQLMIDIGRTRMVPGADLHLHTYLPESATLGLGSVRQRLAG